MASALRVVGESRKPSVTRSPRNASHHPFRHPILRLQQTAGNRAVARLHACGYLQAKLTVGAPDDVYEQEADRVATQVIGQTQPGGGVPVQRQPLEEEEELLQPRREEALPSIQRQEEEELLWARGAQPVPVIQRQEDEELLWMRGSQPMPVVQRQAEEEEEEEMLQPRGHAPLPTLQRQLPEVQQVATPGPASVPSSAHSSKPAADLSSPAASSDIESRIGAGRGGGQSLDGELRSELEDAFGYDFGRVRVHTGTVPDALTGELHAEAFTSDQDVFFRAGRYQPTTEAGRFLIAHELTHVVQQGAAMPLERDVGS